MSTDAATQAQPEQQPPAAPVEDKDQDKVYVASQWQLMWWRFKQHKMALISTVVVILCYVIAIFCEFFAVTDPDKYSAVLKNVPPQMPHFIDAEGKFHLQPFVYGLIMERDPETLRPHYKWDTTKMYPIHFFAKGAEYKMWNKIPGNRHFLGLGEEAADVPLFLLGSDRLGRDMYSRIIYGGRISLSIGLIGVILSLVLGVTLGGISGYYGGNVDMVIQRVIEFLRSMPTIPLWMSLGAALPARWPPERVYFGITLILSLIGWTFMARVVRGRFLALREEDFVMAARLAGSSQIRIILAHMVPSFLSHIIASVTLNIPSMILSETSLSFLGLGLRPPVISWGVLLQEAQNVQSVALSPWLLLPGMAVVIVVLAFNFMGDGLRDAADPYSR